MGREWMGRRVGGRTSRPSRLSSRATSSSSSSPATPSASGCRRPSYSSSCCGTPRRSRRRTSWTTSSSSSCSCGRRPRRRCSPSSTSSCSCGRRPRRHCNPSSTSATFERAPGQFGLSNATGPGTCCDAGGWVRLSRDVGAAVPPPGCRCGPHHHGHPWVPVSHRGWLVTKDIRATLRAIAAAQGVLNQGARAPGFAAQQRHTWTGESPCKAAFAA